MKATEAVARALAAYEGDDYDECVGFRQEDYLQAARVAIVTINNYLLEGDDA